MQRKRPLDSRARRRSFAIVRRKVSEIRREHATKVLRQRQRLDPDAFDERRDNNLSSQGQK